MDAPAAEPSVGALLKTLVGESGVLVRQELTLARAEMTVKAKTVAVSASMVLVGAGVGLAALLGVGAAAIVVLGQVIPLWAACLVVSAIWTVLAAVLVASGLARLRTVDPLPQQTIASLKEVAKLPSAAGDIWPREDTP